MYKRQALHWAAREPYGARALVYALLLDADETIRARQLAHLQQEADLGVHDYTLQLLAALGGTTRQHRLPLLDLAIPSLRQLSDAQYRRFKANLQALVAMDGRVSLFEWTLERILRHALGPDFGEARLLETTYHSCEPLAHECALVFSLLARLQGTNAAAAKSAFAAARDSLGLAGVTPVAAGDLRHAALDRALERLSRLAPEPKQAFVRACAAAALADEQVSYRELEILRAVSAAIDHPLPPILPAGAA